ncbi:kinesin-domain-containing protein [Hysterangium stoloniferum]|nr:kinesin-domain-containing protein [Hysterangium stoloniferum]
MGPPSAATTSVQVAVRIRPTTSHDTISIPARFQRTVVQAASTTSVQVDSTQSAPNGIPNSGGGQAPPSSAAPTKKQTYTFDQVHSPSTSQHALFQSTAEPLISRFLQGFNCTILAYGQTSSGKTYSMTGVDLDADPSDPHNGMGIIPRSVSKIFERTRNIKEERGATWSCTVKGSFIEIYNEDLIDLLGDENLKREVQIREDKDGHIIWGGLREITVKNAGEVMNLIRQGTSIRRTNETDMNAQSSRSHAIFSLTLTQKKYTGSGLPTRSSSPLPPTGRSPSRLARPGSLYSGSAGQVSSPTFGRPPTPSFHTAMSRGGGGLRPGSALGGRISPAPGRDKDDDDVGEWVTIVSKFHFVDLAGSERLKRTAAAGERIKEGISINSGLLALGNVISALGDPARAKSNTASHVPYRDSKLTRLLQDSLGGNANTLMIACVSPAEWNVGETVNTLKYANRARNIRNRAVVNEKEDGWDDIEWLQNMVTRLRKDLKSIKEGTNLSGPTEQETDAPSRVALQQFVELQSQHDELRHQFTQRTEELTRLRRELGESQRASGGSIPGTGKYEEIVGPVIEEYEKAIASMEAELSLNRAALRHTNDLITEKEEELSVVSERHAATELYLEELRARVAKLLDREASTEAYVRDLEEKIKTFDEKNVSSSSTVSDLKREIQQHKDAESHSVAYIADLELRLSRSDEDILSLRERVQRLENEVEARIQAAELLQRRLDEITADGQAWRSDLEQREAKLKELERQLEVWEEKKRIVGEERERLGDVAGDVAKARHSLEIDMQRPINPTSTSDDSVEEQLTALQQTHQATLADLSAVTDKYRDALREISDLASQIQEAKLQAAAIPDPSDDGSEPVVPPSPRRRLTMGGSLRSPRGGELGIGQTNGSGRRSFFRQAASTESLHARSLSQSQSLSQELSSARSRRPSSNSRPESLAIPSPTLLSPVIVRPMSYSQSPTTDTPATEKRSAASLEKEIMRLQEVLKEREAEISSLEQSLKERPLEPTLVPKALTHISEADDAENEVDNPTLKELSPKTLKQFKDLRRLSRRLSLQQPAETPADPSETLDRLNELMLSMAQKESQHREAVDKLNSELNQIRRQHDDLSALSRDQALNMSTELEALRKQHGVTASELEQLQLKHAETSTELENQLVSQANLKTGLEELRRRETMLLDQLHDVQESHSKDIERLRAEHGQLLQQKNLECENRLSDAQDKHESQLAKYRSEVAEAASALARTQQENEDALGKLRSDHAVELEQRSKEVESFLGQSQSEQAETLSKVQGEHAQALKKEIEQAQARTQEVRDEHAAAIAKINAEHDGILLQKEENQAKAIERLRHERTAELSALQLASKATLTEVQVKHDAAIQFLRDEHALLLAAQQEMSQDSLDVLKQKHNELLSSLKESHAVALKDAESDHASSRGELEVTITQLEGDIRRARDEQAAITLEHSKQLEAAVEAAKHQHALELQEIGKGHQTVLKSLRADHEDALTRIEATYQEEQSALNKTHTDVVSQLKLEHKAVLAEVNQALVFAQEQHQQSLETSRLENETLLAEANEKHVTTLSELESKHAKERQTLLKEHELLVQEVAAYRSATDEFVITREQTLEAHEETIVKKDLLIAALEEELATTKAHRTELTSTVESLKEDLEQTRSKTTELVQEASKCDSLVHDLERHRSLLGEIQSNLQKTRDERDNLAAEKNKQEETLRQLQTQLDAQSQTRAVESPVSAPRPVIEHRGSPLSRANGIPPPMTPPPAGPPPPTPGQLSRVAESGATRSSAAMSTTSSRTSQLDASTPATSLSLSNGHGPADAKILARIEEQNRLLDEKEAMIKTLNKQLTHCEGDLQAHMDLVATLETQLNDSERNLRKARMQATEFSKERDRLSGQVDTLRNELQEAKREVVNVRRSIVEEKQSLEHRLDEERKAKERARAQLDSRMEELQKRKSKFACM